MARRSFDFWSNDGLRLTDLRPAGRSEARLTLTLREPPAAAIARSPSTPFCSFPPAAAIGDRSIDRSRARRKFLGISFAVVFSLLWFNTGSFFIARWQRLRVCLCWFLRSVLFLRFVTIALYHAIASVGMVEIVISFPLGMFAWHVLLGDPYVTYLMYLGLFIIMGIGADDIFVLVDAWKQAHDESR